MSAAPSAWAPTPALMTSLRRAGWGVLRGREWGGVRSVLAGLVARLPYGSAQDRVTVQQVADAAGISHRWARECLRRLEELGVIEWQRGGVVDGTPRPSWMRIVKTRLVELIITAREMLADMATERTREVRERIKHLRYTLGQRRGARRRRSAHGEVTSRLHSYGESPPPAGGEGDIVTQDYPDVDDDLLAYIPQYLTLHPDRTEAPVHMSAWVVTLERHAPHLRRGPEIHAALYPHLYSTETT